MVLLNKRGFLETENPNEYVRGHWTIRINNDFIEVFNDPELSKGRYYSGPINKVDLEQLIDEIDEFIKL